MKTRKNIHHLVIYVGASLVATFSSFADGSHNNEREDWLNGRGEWPRTLRVYASTYNGIPEGTVFHRNSDEHDYENDNITNIVEAIRWRARSGYGSTDVVFGDFNGSIKKGQLSEESPFYRDVIEFSNGNVENVNEVVTGIVEIRNGYWMLLVERWLIRTEHGEWRMTSAKANRDYGGDIFHMSMCLGSFLVVDGDMKETPEYRIRTSIENPWHHSVYMLTAHGVIFDSRTYEPWEKRRDKEEGNFVIPYDL